MRKSLTEVYKKNSEIDPLLCGEINILLPVLQLSIIKTVCVSCMREIEQEAGLLSVQVDYKSTHICTSLN